MNKKTYFKKNNLNPSRKIVILCLFIFVAGFCCGVKVADASAVYLNYSSSAAGAQILDVYQEISGAPAGMNERWVRWRFKQYPGGNGAWEVLEPSYGSIQTVALTTTRDRFTYMDGSGDNAAWINYAAGSMRIKRRVTLSGYNQYSAYAAYTATADYDNIYLGVQNISLNGIIRVKINDVVSTSGSALDSNGEYDEAANGYSTSAVWIHIGSNISRGDVIKIEVKGDAENDRHAVIGLKFTNYENKNPGDPNWNYFESKLFTVKNSSQSVAVAGYLDGQTPTFMFGPGHMDHEYNADLSIDMDGKTYTPGNNLAVGQTISGNVLTAKATSTCYGDTQTADDFGTLTRIFGWQYNKHTQSWNINFTRDYTAAYVYASMWPAVNTADDLFRYADLGSGLNVLLPNGFMTEDGNEKNVSTGSSARTVYYGGNANLKLTLETTAPLTANRIRLADAYHKNYFLAGSWEKKWRSGEVMGGHTTTLTLDYQTPESVAWKNKTLYVGRPVTIDNKTDLRPFSGYNVVVKIIPDGKTGLTFSGDGISPKRTFFTSGNDNSVGALEMSSTGSPQKGDWLGVAINGSASSTYNIFSYANYALTLSAGSNAFNNSFNQNTFGINAGAGSTVRNNAIANTATAILWNGNADYNCFPGNTEKHGVSGDPLFVDAESGAFSLQGTSPAINKGRDLGLTSDYAKKPVPNEAVPDIGACEFYAAH